MKKFFLLSWWGRLKRWKYFLNMLLAYALQSIAWIDNMPRYLGLIIWFIWLWWQIYAIAARLHDLWLPWWIAWIRLLLQILVLFWEGFHAIISLVCLIFWCGLLFGKWWECDNEYWTNPYLGKWKHDSNKEKLENIEQKVESEEKDVEKKDKKAEKTKEKTSKIKKSK